MLRARVEPGRRRRVAVAAALIGCLVVIGSSNAFGRAQTEHSYRPDLPPDALTNGCYPLPAGITLPFPYQVRTDGDIATDGRERRHVFLQYDVVDAAQVRADLVTTFDAAGFRRLDGGPSNELRFTKPGVGPLSATLGEIPDLPADAVVRGTLTLDLPPQRLASDSPDCANMFATKRFPPGTPESS